MHREKMKSERLEWDIRENVVNASKPSVGMIQLEKKKK